MFFFISVRNYFVDTSYGLCHPWRDCIFLDEHNILVAHYYHDDIYGFFLADDLVSIPIILLGDFNSRTGIATDFEHLYEHECSFLEENQFSSYFKQHNII